MMKIVVGVNYATDSKVRIDYIDGEEVTTTERVMDEVELNAWIREEGVAGAVVVNECGEDVVGYITVIERYGNEYDVVIQKYTLQVDDDITINEEIIKTMKTLKGAVNLAKAQGHQYIVTVGEMQ